MISMYNCKMIIFFNFIGLGLIFVKYIEYYVNFIRDIYDNVLF